MGGVLCGEGAWDAPGYLLLWGHGPEQLSDTHLNRPSSDSFVMSFGKYLLHQPGISPAPGDDGQPPVLCHTASFQVIALQELSHFVLNKAVGFCCSQAVQV